MESQDRSALLRPRVSVSMITFNQEDTIAQAIESALAQETGFDVEIVIGEDCSTDGTARICREYERAHPEKIRLLERPRNLGAVRNYLETYRACTGEYVAFLEGDDYWTDPRKLAQQVAFLDAHPDYAICCHQVDVVDETGRNLGPLLGDVAETTTVRDLCRGDYIATAACVTRRGLAGEFPEWLLEFPGCDWAVDLLHAEKGKIKYLARSMAVYRRTQRGVWSGAAPIDRHLTAIRLAERLDEHFEHRYRAELNYFIGASYHELYWLIRDRLFDHRHDFPASLPIFDSSPVDRGLRRRIVDVLRGRYRAARAQVRSLLR